MRKEAKELLVKQRDRFIFWSYLAWVLLTICIVELVMAIGSTEPTSPTQLGLNMVMAFLILAPFFVLWCVVVCSALAKEVKPSKRRKRVYA